MEDTNMRIVHVTHMYGLSVIKRLAMFLRPGRILQSKFQGGVLVMLQYRLAHREPLSD